MMHKAVAVTVAGRVVGGEWWWWWVGNIFGGPMSMVSL